MFAWLPWNVARRRRLLATPLPDAWRAILDKRVPLARHLPEADRTRLHGLMQVFLDDKSFEGLGGLEIDDTVRVTIAGQACLLLLGLDVDLPYPGLDVVRVYPDTYRAQVEDRSQDFVTHEGHSRRLGESSRGYIVLAWRHVLAGSRDPNDGKNVVLHEFAHQLDAASGHSNGAPPLHSASAYGPWTAALSEAFSELQDDVRARRRNVLDAYGATNPAEFFAVATETFFEQPVALRRQEPELYAVLVDYWRQDPADHLGRTPAP